MSRIVFDPNIYNEQLTLLTAERDAERALTDTAADLLRDIMDGYYRPSDIREWLARYLEARQAMSDHITKTEYIAVLHQLDAERALADDLAAKLTALWNVMPDTYFDDLKRDAEDVLVRHQEARQR